MVENISSFFLLQNSSPLYGYSNFISLPVDGHLGSFPVLVILNNVTINIHTLVFVWT